MSFGLPQNICQFYNPHTCICQRWKFDENRSSSCWDISISINLFSWCHMSQKSDSVGYADFLPTHPKECIFTRVISGVIGLIFIKFPQDVGIILLLIFFETECQYCNPIWNVAGRTERIYPHFAITLVAMATSLGESEKEVRIGHFHATIYHMLWKNGENQSGRSWDNSAPIKNEKEKEINARKTCSPYGKFAKRAK